MMHNVFVEHLRPGFSSKPTLAFATEDRSLARREAKRLASDPTVRVTLEPAGCGRCRRSF
jgi:hypothetical protein